MTLREACTLAVGIVGGQPTAADVLGFLVADGWQTTPNAVKATLQQLRGLTVEIAVQGDRGRPNRWRLTEAARAWIAQGERC